MSFRQITATENCTFNEKEKKKKIAYVVFVARNQCGVKHSK